jgi:hypothetical protein
VTFSDLSRNPRAVAERARRLGWLRVTHRDAQDFYLTTADREEERNENLLTAAQVFAALARSESGQRAVSSAIAEVFPLVRHLTAAERYGFAEELIAALSDAAELAIDRTAHEVIAGWRPPPGSRLTRACTGRLSPRPRVTSAPPSRPAGLA